jgi:DNA-binding CsgD family transcriptional regulator
MSLVRAIRDYLRGFDGLSILLIVQLVALLAFVVDFIGDLRNGVPDRHLLIEAVVLVGLVIGLLLGVRRLRAHVAQVRIQETAIAACTGALAALVTQRFQEWHLTQAEADVAFFALKGFDTAEIAEFRHAAPSTVRAQLARIYAKAGVPSRAALVAVFFEDLLGGAITLEPSDEAVMPGA